MAGIEAFEEVLPVVAGRHVAVGRGQFCEVLGHDRVTVLDLGAPRPTVLADAALAPGAFDDLVGAVRSRAARVRVVELDTMARTRWRLLWTVDDGPFELHDRFGPRLWLEGSAIGRRRRAPTPRAAGETVVATLSPDWSTREVVIRRAAEPPVVVARRREFVVHLDPTYDYIDLTFDASWAVRLAQALAAALGTPADVTAYD